MRHFFLCFTLISLSTISLAQNNLTVQVQGVQSKKGELRIAIYNAQENFPIPGKQFTGKTVKVNSQDIQVVFENLPHGIYAIALFHDENSNTVLDKNLIGIPKESYGFSSFGEKTKLGPPDWEDAIFQFPEKDTITIQLNTL